MGKRRQKAAARSTDPEGGAAAKGGGGRSPLEQPRASPEPPAGAAGTGGAQGRTKGRQSATSSATAPTGGEAQRAKASEQNKRPGRRRKKAATAAYRPGSGASSPRSHKGEARSGQPRGDPAGWALTNASPNAARATKAQRRKPVAQCGRSERQTQLVSGGGGRKPAQPPNARAGGLWLRGGAKRGAKSPEAANSGLGTAKQLAGAPPPTGRATQPTGSGAAEPEWGKKTGDSPAGAHIPLYVWAERSEHQTTG